MELHQVICQGMVVFTADCQPLGTVEGVCGNTLRLRPRESNEDQAPVVLPLDMVYAVRGHWVKMGFTAEQYSQSGAHA
ncbi:MAG: DUF2171 domain-containing protein [Burkholderiaceae bacterium]